MFRKEPVERRDRSDAAEGLRPPLNLRKLLADLGNRLVQEHGFQPANLYGCSALMNHTLEPLVRFLVWLEHTPEACFILQDMGVWRLDRICDELFQLNKADEGRPAHDPANGKLDGPHRPRR